MSGADTYLQDGLRLNVRQVQVALQGAVIYGDFC